MSFIKRSVKNKFARKRKQSSESDEAESESAVVVNQERKQKTNPNIQGTSGLKSRRKTDNQSASDSASDDNDDIKVVYKSNRSVAPTGPQDQGATAELEIETEKQNDAQAIYEKSIEINKELEGKADDKVYRGLNNYTQFYKKKDSALGNAASGMVRKGPIRAPSNIRSTVRWDYQPDICKDYKETGYCGFGDSCKFLHDRSDYKHGWQLEQEASTTGGTYADDSDGDDTKYEIHSDEEELPFKCYICRESFVDPIVTKCKHYFCEKCALANYKKSTRCAVCGVQTNGMFNPAKELIARLKTREINDDAGSDSD
ncbi:E3 ubiquitin-protein ligase RNF113A [Toxorhynchites rutilus septentrionalis]|uniref:E3 ubiquitin-protein ligase RNF113A n=1 Tax=Toxorhynchites rutilus septentrionalis TaxID=329112 RepID=UPI0024798EA2|nr:E3 ubiquitin-protein ligase RNF113A [Toxorhynchites rutilus septentrionalis]